MSKKAIMSLAMLFPLKNPADINKERGGQTYRTVKNHSK